MSQGFDVPLAENSTAQPPLPEVSFTDRRRGGPSSPNHERRQFADSHEGLSPAAQELARAIDGYKLTHHRRFITYEEMLQVVLSLGYHQ